MNKMICVISLTILLCGCDLFQQTFDYNPIKAYAEIVQRYSVPKGFYAEYTNHRYFIIDDGKIMIMDNTNNFHDCREIEYNWHNIYQDSDEWTYQIGGGNSIMELNGKIIFMLTLKQKYNKVSSGHYYKNEKIAYHYPIFSINTDSSDFCLSDITADIESFERIDNFYYDNDNAKLYTALYRSYDSKEIRRYRYDFSSKHFVKENYSVVLDDYDLTEFYLTDKKMAAVLYFYDDYEEWVVNRLTVFTDYASRKFQQVNMTHLQLSNKPLAVFCDDDDIWLYVNNADSICCCNSPFEFIKIKCIGDVYSLDE